MKKKNLLFTFDYELFLGQRSGSINRCVIEPTNLLINLFERFRIKGAVFFVDTSWLCRLKLQAETHNSAKTDFDKISAQLKQLADNGHYVFPHIHPHWKDAVYIEEMNQWQLNSHAHYRFHSLNAEERAMVFSESIVILKEVLGGGYSPEAYRAGGWSLQPFQDFKPFFDKYGVKYDFSVLPGQKCNSSAQQYDFSECNTSYPYKFSNDIVPSDKGEYVELPISTLTIGAFKLQLNRGLLKFLALTGNTSFGDGIGVAAEMTDYGDNKAEMVSIELLTSVKFNNYVTFLKSNDYMQFIAHPKMLTHHTLKVFEKFLKEALAKYQVETDFKQVVKNYNL